MARPCSICRHPQRAEIEAALVAGEAFRIVAARFGVSTAALQRHKADHLPAVLVAGQSREQAEQAARDGLALWQQLRQINQAALAILTEARAAGNPDLALRAIARVERQLELVARLSGELDERPVVNLLIAPEWLAVRAALQLALGPFPDARAAVAAALTSIEAPR